MAIEHYVLEEERLEVLQVTKTNFIGSFVFQRGLIAGFWLAATLAAFFLTFSYGYVRYVDFHAQKEIEHHTSNLINLYWEEGANYLIQEEMMIDGDPIWQEDFFEESLIRGDFIVQLRDTTDEIVGGFWAMDAVGDWMLEVHLKNEFVYPYWKRNVRLESGERLIVAKKTSLARPFLLDFIIYGIPIIFLVSFFLCTTASYVTSRSVLRRIKGIEKLATQFDAEDLDFRIPTSGRSDEFDRLTRTINGRLSQISELNLSMEATSVGIAHDLRTPLTNIGGFLELMRNDCDKPNRILSHIEDAEDAQKDIICMFDALLRLGEIRIGQRKSAFSTIDFSELGNLLCEAYTPAFSEGRKQFSFAIQPNLTMDGDKELIEQMMSNLMENSLRHSRVAARVFVSAVSDGTSIILKVGDDGPGISPVVRERIFDRFFRAEASRKSKGYGLGLSIVKAVVDLHGASIELEPDAPGAVFVIKFPCH